MKSELKIVFFGNTKYSVINEEALHKKFGLTLVVTIPDRPTGRKRKLTANPVKNFAIDNNIPFLTFEKLAPAAIKTIKQFNNLTIDFIVVADYGLILPNQVLELPKYAAINVHHSLLPKYRGPSPATTAILNGEKISGVTIIKMTWDVDAGDILAQEDYELKPDETTDSLLTELNKLGSQLAINVIQGATLIEGDTLKGRKQDESLATYTKRFTKEDGRIDLADPPNPIALDRMVRAFHPWPGVWTEVELRIMNQELRKMKLRFLPGNLIQPEGKKPMEIKDFLNGYPQLQEMIDKLFKH